MKQTNNLNFHVKHSFIVREASFVSNNKTGQNFIVKPSFAKRINKISDNNYDVSLRVEIRDQEDNPFPFNLCVVISLVSSFDNEKALTSEQLDEYLNVTCVQILFPYLRSVVTSLTGAAMVSPIFLPIINVRDFLNENKK